MKEWNDVYTRFLFNDKSSTKHMTVGEIKKNLSKVSSRSGGRIHSMSNT